MEKIQGRIESVTMPKEFHGVMQIGFKIGDRWYNIPGEEEALVELTENIIMRFNEVQFDYDPITKAVAGMVLIEKPEAKSEEGWQDDRVSFETLLADAHKKFNTKETNFTIETTMISCDMEKKNAVFKAEITITGSSGGQIRRYQAHGDATQENCQSGMIKPHWIRMAETRSIARALRFATNNAKCSEEEK